MSRSPNGMHNRGGWRSVTCLTSDILRTDLKPASSLTSETVVFTEWWTSDEYPALRDYRYPATSGACEHYVVSDDSAWMEDEQ